MKFKPGDKVRCTSQSYGLVYGVVYTVKACRSGYVRLMEDSGEWYDCRFELVEETKPMPSMMSPPKTSAERKLAPVFMGFVRYFPAAMYLVSRLSKKGNDKHNPGQEMHHARDKSSDHGDCIVRHQMDVGEIDPETELDYAVSVAWRAMAQLQELAEKKYGWPKAPGAK